MDVPMLVHKGLVLLAVLPLLAGFAYPRQPATTPPPVVVSFTNDVEPVLTKLGCNQGVCHGQQSGKGGFKLSLRGWDPAFDYEQICKDAGGKRVRPIDPMQSLLLLKPLGRVPHGGGTLLKSNTEDYEILRKWLCTGRPAPSEKDATLTDLTVTPADTTLPTVGKVQPITVTARYSDGKTRDVTRLARYTSQNDAVATVDDGGKVTTRRPGESAVLVSYSGMVRVATFVVPFGVSTVSATEGPVDGPVERKIARLGLGVSPTCTDAEFLRRVSLDVTASLPTPDETRAFLSDTDPKKREKWIDRLLNSPGYVDYRTLRLADLLRINGQFVGDEGAEVYYRWLHEQVERNVPYDVLVRALLTSRGSTYHNGPANYFRVAQNPEDLTETTSLAFLGTRIGCAKCHNHPFENWKQQDYYDFAAFFARTNLKYGPEFGETQVVARTAGEIQNPRTKKNAALRFLGEKEPLKSEPERDRRLALAEWLTAKENRQFARVAVNRLWADFFGRGIVEPVDDFRLSNPPSNPELLEALTDAFIQSGYDQRAVTRLILNSRAYQRSSLITPASARDTKYFARAYPRRVPAEALMDIVGQATGKPERFYPYPAKFKAVQLRDSRYGAYFLEVFGKPKREILCACERSQQPNLAQSLHLVNSGSINSKLSAGDGVVAKLLTQSNITHLNLWERGKQDRALIDELYLRTLCRPPSVSEREALARHIARQKDRRQGLEDVLWALLNSEEFLFQK